MRKIIRNAVNGSKIILTEKPSSVKKVYTILDMEKLSAGGDLNTAYIKHHETVFIEDKLHDWDFYNGVLDFYPHSSEVGETVDILIEYEQ